MSFLELRVRVPHVSRWGIFLASDKKPHFSQSAREMGHPAPAPEATKPVPPKYQQLAGVYPDHPGTGKGNKAMSIRLVTLSDEQMPLKFTERSNHR
jgi:hypothetical protein